jgi:hypothetical protein
LFVDKVHDVIGLYPHPPERAVVRVDEEGQIQALDRIHRWLAAGEAETV